MSTKTNLAANLPWDKRPVTARDMVVLLGLLLLVCVAGATLVAVSLQNQPTAAGDAEVTTTTLNQPAAGTPAETVVHAGSEPAVVEFTLRTVVGGDPAMAFVGVGGDIDGVVNPEVAARVGETVRITVVNGAPMLHDLTIDAFGVFSGELTQEGETVTVEFVADQPGIFDYYCSVPGHRSAGMQGVLRVEGELAESADGDVNGTVRDEDYAGGGPAISADKSNIAGPAVVDAASIVRNPVDLPAPLTARAPQRHVVELTAVEVDGMLDDGTTFRYMTFDGQVPGPMLRMRVGDTMEIRVHNEIQSLLSHSIDLHAVTGPGGGAELTQTLAGETSAFQFSALKPGLYVYHCATPSVAHHISSGMYGLILVEPQEGLPDVDHEFYVMQGEIYTAQPFGTEGHLDFSHEKMLNEDPEYFVFNGAAGALTRDEYTMRAEVGDTVRIYFGVGGPNKISSLHLIGEIFDRVYNLGTLTSPPLYDVQTTLVPPGGATVVELTLDVPGRYLLVDHALSRVERGLVGYLYAEGDENPDVFAPADLAGESGD